MARAVNSEAPDTSAPAFIAERDVSNQRDHLGDQPAGDERLLPAIEIALARSTVSTTCGTILIQRCRSMTGLRIIQTPRRKKAYSSQ